MDYIKQPMMQLFGGFMCLLLGAILASPLVGALDTVTIGTAYTGASDVKNLMPLIWFIALMALGIGLIVNGFRSFGGRS